MLALAGETGDHHRGLAKRAAAGRIEQIAAHLSILADEQDRASQNQSCAAFLAKPESRVGTAVVIGIPECHDRAFTLQRWKGSRAGTGRAIGHDIDCSIGTDGEVTGRSHTMGKHLNA